MDLAIFVILLIVVLILFKDVKWMVYLVGILEIFFQIVHYIGDHLGIIELNSFINNYIPSSTFAVLGKYSNGIVYDILSWLLVLIFIWFLIYLVRYFFKKR